MGFAPGWFTVVMVGQLGRVFFPTSILFEFFCALVAEALCAKLAHALLLPFSLSLSNKPRPAFCAPHRRGRRRSGGVCLDPPGPAAEWGAGQARLPLARFARVVREREYSGLNTCAALILLRQLEISFEAMLVDHN